MGFAVSWCAVREEHAAAMLGDMGLAATGRKSSDRDADVVTLPLPSGWRLVWFEKYNPGSLSARKLGESSKSRDVLVCHIEEHVMSSSAEYWSQGRRLWLIEHVGEDGPVGLDVEGSPPDSLKRIRREMEREQREAGGEDADVDYLFEIPLLVAKELTGFKHDEDDSELIGEGYEELDGGKAPGFFGRLFGGRDRG